MLLTNLRQYDILNLSQASAVIPTPVFSRRSKNLNVSEREVSKMKQAKLKEAPAYRWWVLIMNCIAYGSFFMTIQTTNAFGSAISAQWGLNATKLSLLYTGIMITFAFTAGLGGKLDSKIGMRKTVTLALLINMVAALLYIPLGGSYWAIFVLRICQGFCGGFIAAAGVAGTTLWFPVKQRGLASGITMGVVGLGFSVATAVAPAMLNVMGWQMAIACLVGISSAVIAVVYFLTVRSVKEKYGVGTIDEMLESDAGSEKTAGDAPAEALPTSMAEARKSKRYLAASFFGFGNAWLTYGFSAFLSTFLINDRGVAEGSVTAILSITFIITVIASPLAGVISDKVFGGKRYQTMMIATSMTAVTMVLATFVSHSLIPLVLVLAYASVSMACGPFWALPSQMFDSSIVGEACGELTLIANIGGIIVGPILSMIIDATGSGLIPLITCVVVGVVSAVCANVIHK
jgi:sugar phosphate permease